MSTRASSSSLCTSSTLRVVATALAAALAAPAAHADTSVPSAPGEEGVAGLQRVQSAFIDDTGHTLLGLGGRVFTSPDFFVPDVVDNATFVETRATMAMSLWRAVELGVVLHGGALLDSARAQPAMSLGDVRFALKGGWAFGPVGLALVGQGVLPSRSAKVGFELPGTNLGGRALVGFDGTSIGLPLRLHVDGGYDHSFARYTPPEFSPSFYNGVDGGFLGLATQQWYFDHAHGGLGVEVPLVPLPGVVVTPFIETWYELPLGAPATAGAGAWLAVTPGLRTSLGGTVIDLAADVGVLGSSAFTDGVPWLPPLTVRVGLSHSFDLFATAPSTPAPTLAAADAGTCTTEGSAPTQAATTVASTSGATPPAAGSSADARAAGLDGYVTNRDDVTVEADVTLVDASGKTLTTRSPGGAFALSAAPGRALVVVSSPGYLSTGATIVLDAGGRTTTNFSLRKTPKKRAATLGSGRIDVNGRMPFEFRKARLQSTADYLLEEVLDVLLSNPSLQVRIEAHTDPVGSDDDAQKLTDARARSVGDWLIAHGVAASRLQTKGFGTRVPLSTSEPDKNRRIEFVVVTPGKPGAGDM